jgi:aminomethyltransferase
MPEQLFTPLHGVHLAAGAKMVDYAGWSMPVQYEGILVEHLATRGGAGLFDVSHMGRFVFAGSGSLAVLRRALTNDAGRLAVGQAQYTVLANETGGAIDDAYLYRLDEAEYLLVVNAANRQADFEHLQRFADASADCSLTDRTGQWAMLALQGPRSESILQAVLDGGQLPPKRNRLSICEQAGMPIHVARTGYTGEPVGFELILPAGDAELLWDGLVSAGAAPVGLGARDSLRLEADLPLFGHELGPDEPILACRTCRIAVGLDEEHGEFVGRQALAAQREALRSIDAGAGPTGPIRRVIRAVSLSGRGVARAGALCRLGDRQVGALTSGGAVPSWDVGPDGPVARKGFRSIGLARLDADVAVGAEIVLDVRGRAVPARVVEAHLDGRTPPYARPV